MIVGDMSRIDLGYTTRRRLEPAPEGGRLAVQLRDVHRSDDVRADGLYRYKFEEVPNRHLVRGGEIIFKSRGLENIAAMVDEDLQEPAVVLLPLMVLRPNRKRVVPRYLAWAINQPEIQHRLGVKAQGTSIRMVPKQELRRIDIPLPELGTQHRIVALHRLATHESALLRGLAWQRERLANKLMMEYVTRDADQKESLQ